MEWDDDEEVRQAEVEEFLGLAARLSRNLEFRNSKFLMKTRNLDVVIGNLEIPNPTSPLGFGGLGRQKQLLNPSREGFIPPPTSSPGVLPLVPRPVGGPFFRLLRHAGSIIKKNKLVRSKSIDDPSLAVS